jgi:hypothetical protein
MTGDNGSDPKMMMNVLKTQKFQMLMCDPQNSDNTQEWKQTFSQITDDGIAR